MHTLLRQAVSQSTRLWARFNDLFKTGGNAPRAKHYKRLTRSAFHAAFAIAITLLIRENPATHPTPWVIGDMAGEDIVAPITASIKLARGPIGREELMRRIPPVFDYDDQTITVWLAKWEKAFRSIRDELYGKTQHPHLATVSDRLYQLTGSRISGRDLTHLHKNRFSATLERNFIRLGEHLSRRIISPSNIFPLYYNTGVYVRLVSQSMREVLVNDISRVWSLEQAQDFLSQIARSGKSLQIDGALALVELINPLIPINLTFNQNATQKRFAEALSTAKQTRISVKKGQILIKRGEQITDSHAELLLAIEKRTSTTSSLQHNLLLVILVLIIFIVTLRVELSPHSLWNAGLKDSALFATMTLLQLGSFRAIQPLLEPLRALSTLTDPIYVFPVVTGSIVTNLMIGKEASHLFSILTAILLGYRMDRSLSYTLFVLLSSWAAVHTLRSCRERNDLYKCGLWSAVVGMALSVTQLFSEFGFSQQYTWMDMGLALGYPLISGILSAALTSSLISPLEAIFGYTTSLKLLELSNFNHPLLHTLMLKSPGTYHHSVIVGSLAEIAADKIGANALLARVSAYYHDIGKMTKPLYFIENQSPNHNPHDTLLPSMSAKILFSHVKEGARMAREYNLGALITNIIEQHHGTTLVNYFFNKAKQSEQPLVDQVDESNFRYPGPKPQTKEAAIVMISDACEAATRSINDPTSSKIQTMVHHIIEKRYLEGQFDQCDLLTCDLKTIEDAITRTLQSLYHHRIEYPGQKDSLAAANHAKTTA